MDALASVLDRVSQYSAVGLYITASDCGVCQVLKPKVVSLMEARFPEINLLMISADAQPEISGHFQTFVVPTLIVFFEGKEILRRSRAFGVEELSHSLSRPYHILFNADSK